MQSYVPCQKEGPIGGGGQGTCRVGVEADAAMPGTDIKSIFSQETSSALTENPPISPFPKGGLCGLYLRLAAQKLMGFKPEAVPL